MTKDAKWAINAQLRDSDVSDEELILILTGAESLINSRPITYQSSNPRDDCPLTPNHFYTASLVEVLPLKWIIEFTIVP